MAGVAGVCPLVDAVAIMDANIRYILIVIFAERQGSSSTHRQYQIDVRRARGCA